MGIWYGARIVESSKTRAIAGGVIHPTWGIDLCDRSKALAQNWKLPFRNLPARIGHSRMHTLKIEPLAMGSNPLLGHDGTSVTLRLHAVPFDPDFMMKEANQATCQAGVNQATDVLLANGADAVALGAYTSVVTGSGALVSSGRDRNPPITDGNTFTAVSAVAGLVNLALQAGYDLRTHGVSVVGAAGSTGLLSTILLTQHGIPVTAFGNPKEGGAAKLSVRLRRYPELADVDVAQSPLELSERPFILVCASGVLSAEQVNAICPGSVVVDIGRPHAVAHLLANRKDILACEGSVVRLPQPLSESELYLGDPSLCVACLAEGILLAGYPELRVFGHQTGARMPDAEFLGKLSSAAQRFGITNAGPRLHDSPICPDRVAKFFRAHF